jgi:hypothetical protein
MRHLGPYCYIQLLITAGRLAGKRQTCHHEKAEATAAKLLADIHVQTIAINVTSLVEKIFDCRIAGQDDPSLCSENQAVDRSVFLSPFLELLMSISRWHLSYISHHFFNHHRLICSRLFPGENTPAECCQI